VYQKLTVIVNGGRSLLGDLGAVEEGRLDVEKLVIGLAVGDRLDETVRDSTVLAHCCVYRRMVRERRQRVIERESKNRE